MTLIPSLDLDDPVVQSFLQRHHGGPVVDAGSNAVIGVISRSDVAALHGDTEARVVQEVMSAPPVCVRARARVAEAAGMMLQHRVHRLPVVDDRNVAIGIVTRSDIFEPLIAKQDDLIADQDKRRCVADPVSFVLFLNRSPLMTFSALIKQLLNNCEIIPFLFAHSPPTTS